MMPNTILLVDDDDTTNFLNKYFAEAIDDTIDVVTASNGFEALQFLENNDITAIGPIYIILDVMMPLMDGWEFLAEFEQRFDIIFKEQVTISLLTGLDSEKIIKKASTSSFVMDTIKKPLSEEKFRALLTLHYADKLSK